MKLIIAYVKIYKFTHFENYLKKDYTKNYKKAICEFYSDLLNSILKVESF